ncbi:demethylmenaquinone methyltransferase [Heliobacterium gestii]|uniref:Demethylmenaquinone methyltransferase n=1 Tax=Heliomicrobium gestii TaxID=2699 RepID=A0A845L822_HELGE|nr:demethylmenaquinone methyltransferase [Heliomicrobium gestii]MBM7865479.1 demethylmenaquinone methyltransferase/2-methoxy-6-polyprenyl-1,4-benzoquinol methylase [Heliomicrobium gestii]MZP41731.1 demethylmenaquinone methyltransferase [Heliomicrobium gestii]
MAEEFRSAEEKERFIQSTFSAIAARYDLMNQVMTFNSDTRWRRKAATLSRLPVGGAGLDVCCGTGELAQALAERVGAGGSVVGLDFNADMLTVAREKQREGKLARQIEFIQGNAMELPFPDNRFDTATIGFGLRNVPDFRQALREMTRVVKPGGTVVSLETSKPQSWPMKPLHGFYVDQLVPIIDRLSVGQKGPYAWLARSAQAFLPQEELSAVFREVGLTQVRYDNLFGGVAAIHVGFKPDRATH